MFPTNKKAQDLLQRFGKLRNNPYVFSAHQAREESSEPAKRLPHEEEITREQRLTFFENDEAMRRMWHNDFEAYSQALDNPDLMIKRMEERIQEIKTDIANAVAAGNNLADWWQEEFWGNEAEDFDPAEAEMVEEMAGDDWEMEWQQDELYQKANKWAHRLFEIGSRLYDKEDRKDPDLYRVLINVWLVPAKIVYASSALDEEGEEEFDEIESEVSLQGYTLCLTFLQRVRESLGRLTAKGLAPLAEWRAGALAADELMLEVQGRMIELAKKLRE